jgi:hypothetical protein
MAFTTELSRKFLFSALRWAGIRKKYRVKQTKMEATEIMRV